MREPISGERIPARFKLETSREITAGDEEEHMMYGQLQWCVVFFHEERELDGS